MIDIIERLDKEGINLQETVLNLENQGYKWYYDLWIRNIFNEALWEITRGISIKQLKKVGLL